jgi:hypothetical protein
MKALYLLLIMFFCLGLALPGNLFAQEKNELSTLEIATVSAESLIASQSSIVKRVIEKSPDITQPESVVKGKLEKILEDHPVGELSPFNFLRHAIRSAVVQGVPANTIVLMLMFPLVAAVVALARHVVGLLSFGIFTPALLSVAFLATSLTTGIVLFFMILALTTLLRMGLRRFHLQYLPRMALFMWCISLAVLGIILVSPTIGNKELITLGIFPILILILLVEDYLDLQITRNFKSAMGITIETLVVAIVCYYLMSWELLQKFALVNPEFFTLGVLLVIIMVDRYTGMRLLEIWRFRKIIKF